MQKQVLGTQARDDLYKFWYRLAALRWLDTDDSQVRDAEVNSLLRDDPLSPENRMLLGYLATNNVEALTTKVYEIIEWINQQTWRGVVPILTPTWDLTKRVKAMAVYALWLRGIKL